MVEAGGPTTTHAQVRGGPPAGNFGDAPTPPVGVSPEMYTSGVSRQGELSSDPRTGTNYGYLIQDPRTAVSR
jgi:hypothetical protein